MKIAFHELNYPEGKVKYNDERLLALQEKFKPDKYSPFFAELHKDEFVHADAIIILEDAILDLLIEDMEKIETRLERAESAEEKALLEKCRDILNEEKPLCDAEFTDAEKEILTVLAFLSYKPTVIVKEAPDVNEAIRLCLEKAKIMFFYTAGKKEVHAWPVPVGSDAVTCAGKIHSDLARGFIKADVVSFEDFMTVFNMSEAQKKGLVKLVDKNYIIEDGSIIEIRFNV